MKIPKVRALLGVGVLSGAVYVCSLPAESTHDAWLRYAPIERTAREKYASFPAAVVVLGDSPTLGTAQRELIRGARGMLEKTLRAEKELPREKAIVLGTIVSIQALVPGFSARRSLGEEGLWLTTENLRGCQCLIVTATTDRGVLYGVVALLTKIAQIADLSEWNEDQQSYARDRWADQGHNRVGGLE